MSFPIGRLESIQHYDWMWESRSRTTDYVKEKCQCSICNEYITEDEIDFEVGTHSKCQKEVDDMELTIKMTSN